jgi:sec-independent protein translocase protein TatC
MPVVIYFLAKIGLVSSSFLKKYRRHAFVVNLIVSAIITPPDVTSQLLVSLPLLLLYEISIRVAQRVEKKKAEQ